MKTNGIRWSAATAFLLLIGAGPASGGERTLGYEDVVARLIDLEALAVLPEAGEASAMWSSYDRDSQVDANGRYVGWDANDDGDGIIRMEGDDIVIAEMQGPGAIVRIWSAQADEGQVRIYVDGAEQPVVDLPFRQYFDGSAAPFDRPELVYRSANGLNNYVPIPYQRSCKIVASPGWGRYYHVNYVTFPGGTRVEPFTRDLPEAGRDALDEVNDYLAGWRGDPPGTPSAGDRRVRRRVTIPAGETVTLADIEGAHAIRSFRVKADFGDRLAEETALRRLLLQMRWDDAATPAVWSPLGDFFGSSPGFNEYRTLPLGMADATMYCFWYMPFGRRGQVEVTNTDGKTHELAYEIVYTPLERPASELGRFHAKWHGDVLPIDDEARWPDWTMLRTQGRGRFLGMMLHVLNPDGPSCMEAAGPGHAWWGEGDEKLFVDGERFPSTYGTGTEDYFGYAWGTAEHFGRGYNSQSLASPDNVGHLAVSRLQISDNVPFQSSFEGYLEKYYPNACGTRYDGVAYWYLSAGGSDPHVPVAVHVDRWLPAPVLAPPAARFLDGESVTVEVHSSHDGVRYTLDGSEPTDTSTPYEGPLTLDRSATLKAQVRGPAERNSAVVTGRYLLTSPRPPAVPRGKLAHGLRYAYYEGDWQVLPDFGSVDVQATGVVALPGVEKAEREDDYGLRFTGWVEVPRDGMYTFYVSSDDGSRLYVGDELVLDNDRRHAVTEVAGQVALMAGLHPITLEYFEAKLSNVLEVSLAGPGMEKQPLPAAMLFHAAEAP